MRLAVVLIFVTVVCGLVYYVFSHPGLDRLDELETELAQLEHRNAELAERNRELERQILALRDEPRLAERRARESVGLARPGELIFQFDKDDEVGVIEVPLVVDGEKLELAGETVALDQLGAELERLDDQLPRARLAVEVGEEVGPVRRQRVADIVEAAALQESVWSDRAEQEQRQ